METWGIVVAAGTGSRFGGSKHLARLAGRPLWDWSRLALREAGVTDVVVVGDVEGGIPGGARRQDSVRAGLEAVPGSADLILVHDAARPLASSALVTSLIAVFDDQTVDAAVPGVPVRDTIKRVQGNKVVETLDRDTLVAVQTPQAFRARMLRDAHGMISREVTDDASMVEALGGKVVVIPGERSNLKITYVDDMEVAQAHLARMEPT